MKAAGAKTALYCTNTRAHRRCRLLSLIQFTVMTPQRDKNRNSRDKMKVCVWHCILPTCLQQVKGSVAQDFERVFIQLPIDPTAGCLSLHFFHFNLLPWTYWDIRGDVHTTCIATRTNIWTSNYKKIRTLRNGAHFHQAHSIIAFKHCRKYKLFWSALPPSLL